MPLAQLIRRLAALILAVAVPCAVVGLAVGWIRGLVVAEAIAFSLVLAASFSAERGLLRAYGVRPEVPEGARRSLDRVLASLGGRAPRIHGFNDPSPQALVVRGLGGPGSILVSEGLLGLLSEEELRELLRDCVFRLRARGIRFQSLCGWLAHLVLELAPRAWVELIFGELRWHEDLGVLGALRFLVLFSVARFFTQLGRFASANASHSPVHALAVTGEVVNPGSGLLHAFDPGSARSLLPL